MSSEFVMHDFEKWLRVDEYSKAQEAYEAALAHVHADKKRKFTLEYLGKCSERLIEAGRYEEATLFLVELKQAISKTDRDCLMLILNKLQEIDIMIHGIEFNDIALPNGRQFKLTAKPKQGIPIQASFCEHIYRHYCLESSTAVVFAKNGEKTLCVSSSEGSGIITIPWPAEHPDERVAASLTLTNGNHLVFIQVPHSVEGSAMKSLLIYSPDWKLRHCLPRTGRPPYGTQGLGQSYTGTVCYAEYASASMASAIWRSTDHGLIWHKTLEIHGYLDTESEKRIRHFHLCQTDPYIPGRWYATTGDRVNECLCFVSDDDAQTWTAISAEIEFADPELLAHEKIIRDFFFRTTAVVIGKDALSLSLSLSLSLYFATDDKLTPNGPVFVRLNKQAPFRAMMYQLPTKQEIRSLIEVDDICMVAITQHNEGNEGADILLITKEGEAVHAGSFPTQFDGRHAPVTAGYHSHKAATGRFYTALTNNSPVFPRWLRSLEWQLIEESPKELFDGCPVCDPNIREAVLSGKLKDKDVRRSAHGRVSKWEYHCPHCDSRVRDRTLIPFFHSRGPLPRGKALLVASGGHEIETMQEFFMDEYDNVALHERNNLLSGYDMRTLPQVKSAVYNYVFASCVMDYIPEQHLVATEMFRVLKPGGHFFFNIMPYRTSVPVEPRIAIKNFNALSHEQYNYNQNQHEGGLTNVPNLDISLSWLIECMHEAGFFAEVCTFWDTFTKRLDFWIDARKPLNTTTLE